MRALPRSIPKRSPAIGLGLAAILFLGSCGQEELAPKRPVFAVGVDPNSGASIETNQDDYLPGEVVHLTLRGWAVNEDVRLIMTEDPDTHGDVDTTLTVDENGEWSGHFYDVREHDRGVTFTLTGTGQTSGSTATVVFTDGIFQIAILPNPNTIVLPSIPYILRNGCALSTGSSTGTYTGTRVGVNNTKVLVFKVPTVSGYTYQNSTGSTATITTIGTDSLCVLGGQVPGPDDLNKDVILNYTAAAGSIELTKTWVGAGGQTTLKIGTSIGGSETKLQVTGAAGAAPLTTTPQTVTPGTYYVSETGGLTGYTSTLACTKNGDSYTPLANDGAAVAAGDVVVCTFTNSQKPQLKIVKATVPTTDGGKFDFTVAGTTYNNTNAGYGSGEETVFISLDPGTISISEAGHTGTTLGDYSAALSCNSGKTVGSNLGTSGTVELAFGDVVTCTFTNSRKPQIKMVKATVPTTDLGKFDFTIAGTTYNNSSSGYGNSQGTDFIVLDPGPVAISEAAHSGTTFGDYSPGLACDNATPTSNTGSSGTVTLAYGDVVTCTFTNSRKPQLKVAKATVPTGDGGKFDFTIAGTPDNNGGAGYGNGQATAFVTVATGDVAISETGHSGTTLSDYHSELACDNGKTVLPNAGTSGTVKSLAYGDVITCTFTNSRKPQLKVTKATVPAGDGGTFDFTIGGTGHNNSGAGYGNGQGTDFVTFDAGNVSFSETGHGSTVLTNYTAELLCADGEIAKTVDPNGGSSGTVNLAYGDVITCTFTNTRNATLDVEKVTVGGDGTFGFKLTGFADFDRTTTGPGVKTTSSPFAIAKANFGTKYLVEKPTAGWEITDIDCDANGASLVIGRYVSGSFQNGGSDDYETGDDRVKVTVDAGDNPACTFENTKAASLDIEKISKDATGTFNFDATGLADFSRTTTVVDQVTTSDAITIGVAAFGTKYVEEAVPTGWVVTHIQCDQNGAIIRIGRGSGASFVDGGGNDFDEGDNSVEADIGSGDTPSCTFTNRKKPTLTITKATVPTTDAGKFDFTVAGTDYDNGGAGFGNSENTSAIILDFGQASFSEKAHGTTDLADYVSVLECSKTLDQNVGVSGKVTLAYGDNVSCTFTNKKKPKLKVAKATVPTTDAGKFDFTIDGVGYDNASAGYGNGQATSFIKFDQGSVAIIETAHTGTTLSQYESALACNYGKVPSSNTGTSGTIALVYGEVITCTFTNTKKGSIELKKVWKGEGGQTTLRIGTAQNGYQVDQQQTGANGNTPLTTDATFVSSAVTTYYVSEYGGLTKFSPAVACTNKGTNRYVNATTGAVAVNAGDEVVCTFTNTRIPDVTVTASPGEQQYSDKVELKAALSPIGPIGTVYFYVNGSVDCSTANTGDAVGSASVAVATGEAKFTWPISKPEGSYTVTACFDSGDLNFADGSGTGSLTVTPEDASFSPDAGNVYAYSWAGSTIGPITLKFNMFEKGTIELNKNTSANWAAGNINNEPAANISASLTPLNGGSASVTCTLGSASGPGYNVNRQITCTIPALGLDIYELAIKIGTDSPTTDDFYAGTYEVIVAVSDPTAKLPSGGGFIQLDDNLGESRLNFGFNYSSQGGKASKTIKGGMVAIRHFTSGSLAGWVCRVKTNSLSAPTQTAQIGSTGYWYSSFSGTNVSYNCKDALGVLKETQGNQTLAAYVEDNGEPGRNDTFWLRVFGKIYMPLTAAANDQALTGGNIQVPKPVP